MRHLTPMTDPATLVSPPVPELSRATAGAVRPALSLATVTRDYDGRRVLGPLHLTLDPGVLAVVHGANGAGKTTLLRVAAGLLTPTTGSRDCPGGAVFLRPGSGARHAMSVRSALAHAAALADVPAADRDAEVASVSHLAGLSALGGQRVGTLSTGQHARLSVALAVVTRPVLACLDEPTAHLDRDGVAGVAALVELLQRRGSTVLLATHTPEEFSAHADAVLEMRRGMVEESGC